MGKLRASASMRLKALWAVLCKPPSVKAPEGRIEAIDLARGMAVTLMILSHGVNGLLQFDQIPEWGMVPIHLVTKFASSLFIIVFGVALAVAFLPHVRSPDWPRMRQKLLLRGLVVFFWYKVLTIAEMVHLYEPSDIVDALLYRAFPVYVEILGFYAIALMWIPFVLPLWSRVSLLLRLASPVIMAAVSWFLLQHFDFWGSEPLQAILVEHENHYTWGQISRAPLVLSGLLIGELVLFSHRQFRARVVLAGGLVAFSGLLFLVFQVLATPDVYQQLMAIALNAGKHPPELMFMLFSCGGALFLLSLALLGGNRLASILRPITLIGTDALKAFVFHIFVIFVVLRYLLGLWLVLSYAQVLTLTVSLVFGTALWIKITSWVEAKG